MLKNCFLLGLAFFSTPVVGQDAGDFLKPAKQHELLRKFVGEWTTQSSCTMTPGADPIPSTGTIKARLLGEFWLINEMESSIAGTSFKAIQTVGYDNENKKYVATWIDSLNDYMWKYNGEATGNKLVFEAEGPSYLVPGESMRFRDTYEFAGEDKIRLKSEAFNNGKWSTFMSGTATRKSLNE